MIHFLTNREGAFTMRDFIELHAPELAPHIDVLDYEDLPRRTVVPSGTYILSALDQLTPAGMRMVHELVAQLRAASPACRVLNDPARVLLRYDLLETLYRRGLNQHRAVRASAPAADLRYPVFLREESQHSGSLTPLLTTAGELRRAIGEMILRGYRLGELLIVEYCDTADANGRHRRYSAFVVGGRVLGRELMVGSNWMLKSEGNAPDQQEILEERGYVLGNSHEEPLRQLFALASVDYGRIDYGIRDGRIETWEINLNPTIRRGRRPDPMPLPETLNRLRDPVRAHFKTTFKAALLAEDVDEPPTPIPIRFSDAARRAPPVRTDGATWIRPIAMAMRPAVPRLRRVIDVASPYVARAVLRFTAGGAR